MSLGHSCVSRPSEGFPPDPGVMRAGYPVDTLVPSSASGAPPLHSLLRLLLGHGSSHAVFHLLSLGKHLTASLCLDMSVFLSASPSCSLNPHGLSH